MSFVYKLLSMLSVLFFIIVLLLLLLLLLFKKKKIFFFSNDKQGLIIPIHSFQANKQTNIPTNDLS